MQHAFSLVPYSRLNTMSDPEVEHEAKQALDWLIDVLTSHARLLSREHRMRLIKFAVEKELAGARDQWTEMEKMYMVLTSPDILQPELRLRMAFLMVLQLNFAEHLADIRKLITERCGAIRRTAISKAEVDTARGSIIERIQGIKVEHFACAVPLASLKLRPDIVDDNQGCCPVCQNSYTDLSTNTPQELLDDFPTRIKHCGHIIGKGCLEQWMDTPKIEAAKYPHRTCPLCRVKIEGVPAPSPPTDLRTHMKTDRRAMEILRELFYEWDIELDEALDAVVSCMSEEIACEELLDVLKQAKGQTRWGYESDEKKLEMRMAELNKEKRAWGFRGEGIWRPFRDAWMDSGPSAYPWPTLSLNRKYIRMFAAATSNDNPISRLLQSSNMGVHVVDVGVSTTLGDRGEQQDRYITVEPRQMKSRKELALFAIFDGHGGTEAVAHIHKNLIKHLEDHFASTEKSPNAESYKQAIQRSLKAVDRDINRDDLDGGATVALVLVDTKQNLLVEADLGDSHVIFADHSEHSGSLEEKKSKDDWDVAVLSKEHTPDAPEEKKRIEEAGGEVNYSTGIARVGAVSMSRALGDMEYKKPKVNRLAGHDLSDLDGVETGVAPGATVTHDLVSNKAHFSTRQLNGQSLIMLASDGVGDAEEASEDAREAVKQWTEGKELKAIAESLTKRAGKVKNADNCTVLLVVLDTEGKGGRRDSGLLEPSAFGRSGSPRRSRRRSSISSVKDSIKDLLQRS
ncbi:protein serine/threonine phosphatase 2C [Ophiobolus disseminans]|uniref:Protein serine/threonine phosphatase 2C n=1 Tax=Ophiobolus disseminans TaxID=1469910 RepID=A0A6A7A262_9PLEO|nr:protein serine/threonine phosphatase 2C [Ophiobolus disseminans]